MAGRRWRSREPPSKHAPTGNVGGANRCVNPILTFSEGGLLSPPGLPGEGDFMMRRWFGLWVCCAAVFVPGAASAPQMTGKVVVLKAARLFDGKSDALVTPGLVVVTDGKITAVGANAAVP